LHPAKIAIKAEAGGGWTATKNPRSNCRDIHYVDACTSGLRIIICAAILRRFYFDDVFHDKDTFGEIGVQPALVCFGIFPVLKIAGFPPEVR